MYMSTCGAARPGNAASAPLPKAWQGPHRLDGATGPSGVAFVFLAWPHFLLLFVSFPSLPRWYFLTLLDFFL